MMMELHVLPNVYLYPYINEPHMHLVNNKIPKCILSIPYFQNAYGYPCMNDTNMHLVNDIMPKCILSIQHLSNAKGYHWGQSAQMHMVKLYVPAQMHMVNVGVYIVMVVIDAIEIASEPLGPGQH
jgi:hypothetical protein